MISMTVSLFIINVFIYVLVVSSLQLQGSLNEEASWVYMVDRYLIF